MYLELETSLQLVTDVTCIKSYLVMSILLPLVGLKDATVVNYNAIDEIVAINLGINNIAGSL